MLGGSRVGGRLQWCRQHSESQSGGLRHSAANTGTAPRRAQPGAQGGKGAVRSWHGRERWPAGRVHGGEATVPFSQAGLRMPASACSPPHRRTQAAMPYCTPEAGGDKAIRSTARRLCLCLRALPLVGPRRQRPRTSAFCLCQTPVTVTSHQCGSFTEQLGVAATPAAVLLSRQCWGLSGLWALGGSEQ